MSVGSRRGVSLAELLVALVMFGIVAGALLRWLSLNMRLYQTQTQVIDRGQNLRAASMLLTAELRELSATDGDLYAATSTSLSFRAMRRMGFVCAAAPAGATALLLRQQPQFGSRDFDPASDSLLIFAGDWRGAGLAGARSGTCADGAPAVILETTTGLTRDVTLGAPVRGFEPVTYRLYRGGDNEWHVGLEAGSDVIQPLVGPMTPDGFALAYRDASGQPTTQRARVASIEVRLRMPTAQRIRDADGALVRAVDSVTIVIALRNNRVPV